MSALRTDEREFIRRAVHYLERPTLLVKFVDILGSPLESLVKTVPPWVSRAVDQALLAAMKAAAFTIPAGPTPRVAGTPMRRLESRAFWKGYWHTATCAVSGGTSGLLGAVALPVELPLTTCTMLRSMASVAGAFGHDVRDPAIRLECLSLFSLGGPTPYDDEMESSYLMARTAMATLVAKAGKFLANSSSVEVAQSIATGTAPTLVGLIAKVAGRFKTLTMQKVLAESMPVIGAVGAASINVVFADHFNQVARYHFGLRHLEQRRGTQAVQARYRFECERQHIRRDERQPAMPTYREGLFLPDNGPAAQGA